MQLTNLRSHRTVAESRLSGFSIDDPEAGMRMMLCTPEEHPEEWAIYLDQAEESYGTHGVELAVRREQLAVESCAGFWHIEERATGAVIGGMRLHGPYPSVEEAWGLQEFAKFPEYVELAALIEPLIPYGLIENKGAYMAVDTKRTLNVPSMFARAMSLSIEVVRARALMGTTARHTLPLWQYGGCVIPRPDLMVPYPDDRYETVLVLHEVKDRQTTMSREVRVQRIRDWAAFRGVPVEVGRI